MWLHIMEDHIVLVRGRRLLSVNRFRPPAKKKAGHNAPK